MRISYGTTYILKKKFQGRMKGITLETVTF